MKFLDRKAELKKLQRLSDSRRGGFVAIWGRRRIGKSELLKIWCRMAGGVYFVSDRSTGAVQRESLAAVIATHFAGFDSVIYPTWKALFAALSMRAAAERWHGPLVLDEFPYLVESDQTLPSVLQNWIDSEKAAGGLLVAIAGSSQHMMHGLVIEADSPLYGRADERMRLKPLGIEFISEGLKLRNPLDAIRAYSVWGGVPRYWVAAEAYGADLDAAVDEMVLDPLGLFHDEPTTLLQSELPNAISLKPYLDIIGSGVNRASEIASRMGVSVTTLPKQLTRLVELGLVKREIPYGESEKSTKKSLYKVADPFCKLWFRILASRRSIFENSPARVRMSIWHSLSEGIFASEWEEQSRLHVARSQRLQQDAGESDFWLPAGRWWQASSPELDVVSVNGSKTRTLIGEAKWSEKPFGIREVGRLAKELNGKAVPAGLPSEAVRCLFVSSVAKGTPAQIDGVRVVSAEEVIFDNQMVSNQMVSNQMVEFSSEDMI